MLPVVPAATHAGAELPPAFVGTAAASGGRVSFVVPGQFAVEEILDGGGPVAQSKLDGLGGDSFASLPYPGGTAVAYQGLFAVATGISSPFAYPAYVSASNPGSPTQEVSDPSGSGAYHLLATATPAGASGLARFRPGSEGTMTSGGEATTRVAASGSTVVAAAQSLSEGVDVAKGTVRISSVRSHATTTWTQGSATPVTDTGLEVDGLKIGDVSFGVGPKGFVVLGRPIPYSAADIDALVGQLLQPSGVHLRLVDARPIAGGAQAAALEITGTSPPGPNGATGTVTLRLGGAASAISVGEGPLPPPPPAVVEPIVPPPPPPAAPTFATGAGAGGPSSTGPANAGRGAGYAAVGNPAGGSSPTGGTAGSGLDAAALGPGSIAPAGPAGPAGNGVSGSADLAARVVAPRRVTHIRTIYGFLAAAAALMFLVGMAWAGRGDRAWPVS